MTARTADYALEVAFNELVAGVFYIDTSALDGSDGLSDLGLFAGSYDQVTDDIVDTVAVTAGTDALAGAVQAASLQVELLDPNDLSKWNPNNPASPLNGETPGFEEMRPVRLVATTDDAVEHGVFWGFISRADWNSDSCSCQLYCEDLLLWASRVNPTITATGPTTTGAAIGLILDAIGWTDPAYRSLDTGDQLDDFTADGTSTALQLIADLLTAERGSVFVRGDGVVVYEDRYRIQARSPSATLDDELFTVQSGIDITSVYTRANVNGATSIDSTTEKRKGRGDYPAISSSYVVNDQALADDLVYELANGKPPVTVDVDNDDGATLDLILDSPLRTVFTINETLGGTQGDYILQRAVQTISPGSYHKATYTLTKRTGTVFTVDGSALDGTDPLRY